MKRISLITGSSYAWMPNFHGNSIVNILDFNLSFVIFCGKMPVIVTSV